MESIRNIQRHGLSVRGLFILGADNHTVGVGDQLADFVIENHIKGALIQCMYFVPGTPVYESHKDRLLHKDWSRYNGNAVHIPEKMTPYELQLENIRASKKDLFLSQTGLCAAPRGCAAQTAVPGRVFLAYEHTGGSAERTAVSGQEIDLIHDRSK